jgi:hypothetical protein
MRTASQCALSVGDGIQVPFRFIQVRSRPFRSPARSMAACACTSFDISDAAALHQTMLPRGAKVRTCRFDLEQTSS